MNNLIIFNFLPIEIMYLINYHLQALKIQQIFKINRPLTDFEIGDRVIINYNSSMIFTKIYGTIIKIYDNICKIKLLPRLIPNWKKCNINFWKNYQNQNYKNLIEGYNFPYYTPKDLNIKKSNIIKLQSWNDKNIENIDNIDSTKRIDMYMNYNKNLQLNYNILESGGFTNKSNIFGYLF